MAADQWVSDPTESNGTEMEHSTVGPSAEHNESLHETPFRFPRVEESSLLTSIVGTEPLSSRLLDWEETYTQVPMPRRLQPRSPGRALHRTPPQEASSPILSNKFMLQMIASGLLLLTFFLLKTDNPAGAAGFQQTAEHLFRQDSLIPVVTAWYGTNVAPRFGWPIKGRLPIQFVQPIEGEIVADYDRKNQQEMILGGTPGENVHAAASGTVEEVGKSDQQGNYVVIAHNANQETIYAHLGTTAVKTGSTIQQGAIIGSLPSTTNSVLYFGYRVDGQFANPHTIVTFKKP